MPEIVSADTGSKIDFRILVGIFAGVISFQIYLGFLDSVDVENFTFIISLVGIFLVAIASLIVAKKQGQSKISKAFYSLSIGFFCLSIGEILYYNLPLIGIDPYPSIGDLFYFLYYPFAMIHLIINSKFYQKQFNFKRVLGMVLVAAVVTIIYAFFAFELLEGFNFDFTYGLIFVAGASAITAVGFYAAVVARGIPLRTSWFLLVTGILLGTIADVWYQSLELLGAYDGYHIVNLFWHAGYFVIAYSLYKHYKIM